MEELRQNAFDSRADLRAAIQAVDKARTDYRLAVANGSTDPTFVLDVGREEPVRAYFGVGINIPLRIFDRNQGEKARTQLDIKRNERLVEANRAQIFSDVDSAYATLQSDLILLRPYKTRYLRASRARAGDHFVFLSAWRRLAARFPASAAGLPRHSTELPEPGRGPFSAPPTR